MTIFLRTADNPDVVKRYDNVTNIYKENHLIFITQQDEFGIFNFCRNDIISLEVN